MVSVALKDDATALLASGFKGFLQAISAGIKITKIKNVLQTSYTSPV